MSADRTAQPQAPGRSAQAPRRLSLLALKDRAEAIRARDRLSAEPWLPDSPPPLEVEVLQPFDALLDEHLGHVADGARLGLRQA
jgi:hypothetical protein